MEVTTLRFLKKVDLKKPYLHYVVRIEPPKGYVIDLIRPHPSYPRWVILGFVRPSYLPIQKARKKSKRRRWRCPNCRLMTSWKYVCKYCGYSRNEKKTYKCLTCGVQVSCGCGYLICPYRR